MLSPSVTIPSSDLKELQSELDSNMDNVPDVCPFNDDPEINPDEDCFEEPPKKAPSSSHLETTTMEELFDKAFPSRDPIIENFLMPGAILLAGSAKIGKSFLVLQIAYSIATGKDFWGYKVRQGDVLYLALEDGFDRLQKRLYDMFDVETTEHLHLANNSQHLSEGLETQIENFIAEHPNTRLVIIDTLQKVRESGADKYSYANDYDVIGRLKAISDRHNLCILIVHHVRKMPSDDPFDEISGTNGLLGAADGAIIMSRERACSDATLTQTSRDQPEQKFELQFDNNHCIWNLVSVAIEPWMDPPEPILESISHLLSPESKSWKGTATELVESLHSEYPPNSITKKLNVLSGKLEKEYGIHFNTQRRHSGRTITLAYIE